MTDLAVAADGKSALWLGRRMRCAIGKGGLVAAADKREGDGATPIGIWPMRRVLYRSDRLTPPVTALPMQPLQADDGWCDAPGDAWYNQPVRHPYPASAERLWRDDHVYDLIVPLGYNDNPCISGKGSAIFLHMARPDYAPTEGCVALGLEDLLEVLRTALPQSRVLAGTSEG